jgi:molybdopterin/thiamine biosynthesis adenylyltransferase
MSTQLEFSLDKLRSLEIIDFNLYSHLPIHIVGMGAVGSRIFEQLVTLGARNLVLHDADVVEGHNLHNQLYLASHVGMPKVEAAANWFELKYGESISDTTITTSNEFVAEDTDLSGIVFLAVDSFDGRRDVSQACANSSKVPLVIEGRCAPSFIEMHSFNPLDPEKLKWFHSTLGSDKDADPYLSICGLPISFSTIMTQCAITMTMVLINYLKYSTLLPQHNKLRFLSGPIVTLGSNVS